MDFDLPHGYFEGRKACSMSEVIKELHLHVVEFGSQQAQSTLEGASADEP